jgi:hypothetical protein
LHAQPYQNAQNFRAYKSELTKDREQNSILTSSITNHLEFMKINCFRTYLGSWVSEAWHRSYSSNISRIA